MKCGVNVPERSELRKKGWPDTMIKLLRCDLNITSSSRGNSHHRFRGVRLRTSTLLQAEPPTLGLPFSRVNCET